MRRIKPPKRTAGLARRPISKHRPKVRPGMGGGPIYIDGPHPVTCQARGCGNVFTVKAYRLPAARFCCRECSGNAKKYELSDVRKGKANPNYRHGKRVGDQVRAQTPHFLDPAGICRHPNCVGGGWDICQHHVVYRQEIRRRGGPELDGRDALGLCRRCHSSHHQGGVWKVPLTALRDENYEFARELMGPGAAYEYLRRRYKGEDPRLEALLIEWEDAA